MIGFTEIYLLKRGTRELEGPLSFISGGNKGNAQKRFRTRVCKSLWIFQLQKKIASVFWDLYFVAKSFRSPFWVRGFHFSGRCDTVSIKRTPSEVLFHLVFREFPVKAPDVQYFTDCKI